MRFLKLPSHVFTDIDQDSAQPSTVHWRCADCRSEPLTVSRHVNRVFESTNGSRWVAFHFEATCPSCGYTARLLDPGRSPDESYFAVRPGR